MAVTGANGRLGRALLDALGREEIEAIPWYRADYDLDDPGAAARVVEGGRPDTVIHSAAWTDVDGCARDPTRAMRRNAEAVGELADSCAGKGVRLVVMSTNEVFDGQRTDGLGYAESDPPHPINPYGESKLAGERMAQDAFDRAGRSDDLLIVRTAWLFGPPGNDFPSKILKAADALPQGEPLNVVADEVGSPTYSVDLARAIVQLVHEGGPGGVYHLVNEGQATRLDVALRVLGHCRPARDVAAISRTQFSRASSPPAWAVLRSSRPAAVEVTLRPWSEAIDAYAPSLCAA